MGCGLLFAKRWDALPSAIGAIGTRFGNTFTLTVSGVETYGSGLKKIYYRAMRGRSR
jgi:hypothetical protein